MAPPGEYDAVGVMLAVATNTVWTCTKPYNTQVQIIKMIIWKNIWNVKDRSDVNWYDQQIYCLKRNNG